MKHIFKKQDFTKEQESLKSKLFICFIVITSVKYLLIDNISQLKHLKTAYMIFELISFAVLIGIGIRNKVINKFALIVYGSIAIILATIVYLRK
ncbi:MAG: hypothetical protein RL387_1241 [Bacteroidota bacterium]|jgi:glucan phosphoethanolaminetransferase (alkaline phosphatase superfamily)